MGTGVVLTLETHFSGRLLLISLGSHMLECTHVQSCPCYHSYFFIQVLNEFPVVTCHKAFLQITVFFLLPIFLHLSEKSSLYKSSFKIFHWNIVENILGFTFNTFITLILLLRFCIVISWKIFGDLLYFT